MKNIKRDKNGRFVKGNRAYIKNLKPFSKKHKSPYQFKKDEKRLTDPRPERSGKRHWNWRGGTSFEPYTIDWTETLRISIRERDCYICQLCEKKQGDRAHSIHHIDYDKKNCDPRNLITLCVSCHNKTNSHRSFWKRYFSSRALEVGGGPK